MILRPGEYYTIARVLGDHTDSTQYYVRAVIRNARTDATIATVDLTSQTVQRYSKPWQVPQDSSGLGVYLLITTTVYTDSGYTAKSPNHYEETVELLVDERYNPRTVPMGGGADISYEKIKKIFHDELQQVPRGYIRPKEVDLKPLESLISTLATPADVRAVEREVGRVLTTIAALPRFEKTEFGPTLDRIALVLKAVQDLPDYGPVNLEPVVSRIQIEMEDMRKKTLSALKHLEKLAQQGDIQELRKTLEDATKALAIGSIARIELGKAPDEKPVAKFPFLRRATQ